MKIAASVLIVAAAAFAAYALAIAPYAQNLDKLALERNTRGAELAEPFVAARTARANILTARQMLQKNPADVDLYMMLASNQRIVGENQEALAAYDEALRVRPRPEIYLTLGQLQLEMGQRDAAIENMARAVRFEEGLAEEIEDPAVREAVEKRVAAMP